MLFFLQAGLACGSETERSSGKITKKDGEMMQIHVDSIGEMW